jgi:hypothetical protein
MLDGKDITDTARQFLRNWHATRESNKKKHEEILRQKSFMTEMTNTTGTTQSN